MTVFNSTKPISVSPDTEKLVAHTLKTEIPLFGKTHDDRESCRMIYLDALWTALGLSMDATAVSMSDGLAEPHMKIRKMCAIALAFGLFQFLFCAIGFLIGSLLTQILEKIIPALSFIVLFILGAKMLWDGIKRRGGKTESLTAKAVFFQCISTSVDALTIGVLYARCAVISAFYCFSIIAGATVVLGVCAIAIGKYFGTRYATLALIIGGIILIAIGSKALLP